MTKYLTALAIATIPAFAFANTAEVDANGDGALSIEEMQAVYADITADGFAVMDANGDGLLDADEHQAALDAGVLVKSMSDG